MSARTHVVLLLWGRDFEAVDAVIFVTALRQSGLKVKVVGVGGGSQAGAHGIAIVPDLTLGQALALIASVNCIIVPCRPLYRKQLRDDPRYRKLLDLAPENETLLVLNEETSGPVLEMCEWSQSSIPQCGRICYPKKSLVCFAEQLAAWLNGKQSHQPQRHEKHGADQTAPDQFGSYQ